MNTKLIYLVQTDTTAGFLNQDKKKLNKIKKRPLNQKILKEVDSLETLKTFTRIPNKFKWMYSTSANETNKTFNKEWAIKNADVIVLDKRGFFEGKASTILKVNNKKQKKIR